MVAVAVAIALQHVCLVQALIEPKSECQDGITSDALFAAGSFHMCAVRVDHLCAALAAGADLHAERARPQTRRVLAPARRTSASRGACARASPDVVCVVPTQPQTDVHSSSKRAALAAMHDRLCGAVRQRSSDGRSEAGCADIEWGA